MVFHLIRAWVSHGLFPLNRFAHPRVKERSRFLVFFWRWHPCVHSLPRPKRRANRPENRARSSARSGKTSTAAAWKLSGTAGSSTKLLTSRSYSTWSRPRINMETPTGKDCVATWWLRSRASTASGSAGTMIALSGWERKTTSFPSAS